jgi:misacylated tRNA(Ala) deacylase
MGTGKEAAAVAERSAGDRAMKSNMDPRMHSAEHILNQTMIRMFQTGRCFTAHIEKKKSKCDYRFDRPLTEEETRRLEAEVNRIIHLDLPVHEEFMSREESEKRFNLDRVPDEAGDMIRIVTIGDYDACPCFGPHVGSTSEIGGFLIGSVGFEEEVLRIRFKLSAKP